MEKTFKIPKEAGDHTALASDCVSTKQRVLEAACYLFSERGFQGTHIRDICKHAGVNVGVALHHFHRKGKLYEAVAQEAYQRLGVSKEVIGRCPKAAPPEERLRGIVESLFGSFRGEHAWIAKLLARELLDPVDGMPLPVGAVLGRDFVLLQRVIQDLLGPRANLETVRLHSLSVVSQCMFYCLAGDRLHRVFPQLLRPLPDRESLVRHVVCCSLEALGHGQRKRNYEPGGSS